MSARTLVLGRHPLIVRNNLTAAGTTRATALQLTGDWNRITSVPSDGNGVRLPPAFVGAEVVIVRADYTNTNRLAVHAMGTDGIGPGFDVLMLNADHLAAATFFCLTDGVWDTDVSVPSVQSVAAAKLVGAGAVSVTAAIYVIGIEGLAGAGAVAAAAVHKSPLGVATPHGVGAVSCVGPN